MNSLKKFPVFIHSLFRTGSTYLWNRLRQVKSLHCYYEPFHPELLNISSEFPDVWRHDPAATATMHHPKLDAPYLEEYAPMLREAERGIPGFLKSFGLDSFCDNQGQPGQSLYLNSLIDQAGDKRAVFQFNRTALRSRWFRNQYPRGLHIYLARNPGYQFESQLDVFRNLGIETFFVMDLMAAALNRETPEFFPLARVLPLPLYPCDDFPMQRRFYSRVASAMSMRERYFLFYFLWFTALVENLHNPKDILSIDALSLDENYRESVADRLSDFIGDKVDFSDADVRQYSTASLPDEDLQTLRRAAQSLVLSRVSPGKVAEGISALSPCVRQALRLDSVLPDPSPDSGDLSIPGLRPRKEIENAQIEILGADMERKFQEGRLLRGLLRSERGEGSERGKRIPDEEIMRTQKQRLDYLAQRVYELEAMRVRERTEVAGLSARLGTITAELEQSRQEASLLEKTRDNLKKKLHIIQSSRWYRCLNKLGLLRGEE